MHYAFCCAFQLSLARSSTDYHTFVFDHASEVDRGFEADLQQTERSLEINIAQLPI
ncbi:hypothetical protein [Candidatus Sulfurimonas marisnigri]|uniref:hypothetical protein n=1 Tax=Candidatus Sulfurimonas marisnigri TaxID=2740405 RepID=UPI001E2D7064|nr:hypothetical protein [Candidatus Sulfurimonas marisnigri]